MPPINLYTVTVPPMIRALENLSALIDKAVLHADTKKTKVEQLLAERLIFDQFSFIKQVQVACNNAKRTGAVLAGVENPAFEDAEQTPAELKTRIERTVAFLKALAESDFAGKEEGCIEMYFLKGRCLPRFEYAIHYAMPNFYFHIVTAYSILRANGVDIGKADYLGALPYLDLPAA